MSEHADTIREALRQLEGNGPVSGDLADAALAALDVLAGRVQQLEAERDEAIVRLGCIIVAAREAENLPASLRAAISVGEDDFFNRPTAEGTRRRTMLDAESLLARKDEALRFYADRDNWTQSTSWGGRIHDDESRAILDGGHRARAALGQA